MSKRKRRNTYGKGFARVWLQVEPAGEDLDFAELVPIGGWTIDEDGIGRPKKLDAPEWLIDELSHAGWDSLLHRGWKHDESGEGWSFRSSVIAWAKAHRIAPYQAFLVEVREPEWSTDYWGESDVYYGDIRFWYREKLTDDQREKNWADAMSDINAYREASIAKMRELKERRANDIGAMSISTSWWHTRGYCEMTSPNGIILRLCSNHTSIEGLSKFAWHDLVEARDEGGDREKAMQRLIEKAVERYPNLTEEIIRALPRR